MGLSHFPKLYYFTNIRPKKTTSYNLPSDKWGNLHNLKLGLLQIVSLCLEVQEESFLLLKFYAKC